MDAKEVFDNVTTDSVIKIMEDNGSPLYKKDIYNPTGEEILWFKTICHCGDSHKLCYFTKSKDFFCYTSCGRMKFYDLIKKVKKIPDEKFGDAVNYVAKEIGFTPAKRQIGFLKSAEDKDFQKMAAFIRKVEEDNDIIVSKDINKFYDENSLLAFDNNVFYEGWIEEGITIQTMYKFGIRWYGVENHIIIPHRNADGKLVGVRRRSLKPEDSKNKYMPEFIKGEFYDHQLGLNLYGLYENKEAIKKYRRAIIVEAEKSVMISDSFYGEKSCAVATCGFNISTWQKNTLIKLGVEEVILGFDKDFDITKEDYYLESDKKEEYLNYKRRIESLAKKFAHSCRVYVLEDKKGLLKLKDSPFDRGKETFEKLMASRREIKFKDIQDYYSLS